jgi:hypothetical protein
VPLMCLASAHSRSSLPSMRKSEFATSTPLSGSGLINGIEAISRAWADTSRDSLLAQFIWRLRVALRFSVGLSLR